jgi:lysophospholipase L1-like esterase
MSLTAKLLLTPLLVTQALVTRARLPRLPEAEGERMGSAGSGAEPGLRLLVAGDSSAAGVGVSEQRHALARPLADELAALARRRVHWRLHARSGLTTTQLHEWLREELDGRFEIDIALVVTGVNDVVDQIPSHRAMAAREALANWLRNARGVRHVAFAPLPPVHQFPGLPQPLRWVAGSDAQRHNRALVEWAGTRGDVSAVPIDLRLHAAVMADDGFHPGAPAYRHVAHQIARHLAALVRAEAIGGNSNQEETPNEHPPHLRHAQPARQDALHHRREPRHRPGDRQESGGRRRPHRAGGQDHRAQPQAAGHAVQRR